jgi:type III secretory pathway lipoprotein EscJ
MHRDQSRRFSAGVTPAQVIGIGLVVASLGWAAWLLRDRPISEEVELLPGSVLPSSELAIIEAAFDRAQLTDHRTEDGRVWVPRPRQSAYMRALVDADAMPGEFGSTLREAVKQTSPWSSPRLQEEVRRVAVQEELSRVICSMPGIERAAVFYDIETKPGGPLGREPERTASVNIKTQPGIELEPSRVEAIRVLVASSIAGLPVEQVAVTDLRSGRVFAGPITDDSEAELADIDPALARQVAYERHLATKLRQAMAYVKGAVIDVTVRFAPPAPRLPAPPIPSGGQHVAGANLPAAVGDPLPLPRPEEEQTSDGLPDTIFVSMVVPDDFFAGLDASAASDAEDRIRDHVMSVLPMTSRPEGKRLVVNRFRPSHATGSRTAPRPARVGPSPPATQAGDERHVSLEAAWHAILDGRAVDVPREVWLAVIAVAAGLLGMLVLRPRRGEPRPTRTVRKTPDRIDWSSVDGESAADSEPHQRVAA